MGRVSVEGVHGEKLPAPPQHIRGQYRGSRAASDTPRGGTAGRADTGDTHGAFGLPGRFRHRDGVAVGRARWGSCQGIDRHDGGSQSVGAGAGGDHQAGVGRLRQRIEDRRPDVPLSAGGRRQPRHAECLQTLRPGEGGRQCRPDIHPTDSYDGRDVHSTFRWSARRLPTCHAIWVAASSGCSPGVRAGRNSRSTPCGRRPVPRNAGSTGPESEDIPGWSSTESTHSHGRSDSPDRCGERSPDSRHIDAGQRQDSRTTPSRQ